MSREPESAALSWASAETARKWAGTHIVSTSTLKGDASSRRFWRINLRQDTKGSFFFRRRQAPQSAVVVDLGSDDLPLYARALSLYPRKMTEPPWVNVHRFLASIGAPVPELYGWSPGCRALLVEDVGSISLCDAARAAPANSDDLYREAVRALVRIHVEGTLKAQQDRCVATRVAYDERLFAWEMEQFVEYALAAVSPGANPEAVRRDLAQLASRLDRLPRVFSHRDFHGNNLFIQGEDRIRIIDFQDALMAPAAQDLSVLLTTRDTGEFITPKIENRLLEFYYAALVRAQAATLGYDEFVVSYRLCVLQHAIKVMGRFLYLERNGKTGYARYVRHAVDQARRMLALADGDESPDLRAALAP